MNLTIFPVLCITEVLVEVQWQKSARGRRLTALHLHKQLSWQVQCCPAQPATAPQYQNQEHGQDTYPPTKPCLNTNAQTQNIAYKSEFLLLCSTCAFLINIFYKKNNIFFSKQGLYNKNKNSIAVSTVKGNEPCLPARLAIGNMAQSGFGKACLIFERS